MQEVTISKQAFEQLQAAAKEMGRTPEAVLAEALQAFLKDHQ